MYEDNWLIEFKNRAAPRLREMFERDLEKTPAFLSDLLARLQQLERERAPANAQKMKTPASGEKPASFGTALWGE